MGAVKNPEPEAVKGPESKRAESKRAETKLAQAGIIKDVIITPLKRFPDERGTVMHMMKATDPDFKSFAEVYASTINPGAVKGWHFHTLKTRSYVVLAGMIKLVLYDEREGSATRNVLQEVFLGDDNYVRVTIPPGIWSGFKGISQGPAIVCDIVDHGQDPEESRRLDPHHSRIPYKWERKDR